MKEEFHDCDYYDSDLSVYITAKIDIFVTFFFIYFRIQNSAPDTCKNKTEVSCYLMF